MKCLLIVCLSAVLLCAGCATPAPTSRTAERVKAFPTAEGYGRHAQGGRGGDIYFVDTLEDNSEGSQIGPGVYQGSFRYACEASGPRTVVFRVGGTIVLDSPIDVTNGYLTIAGQTAPGDGIGLAAEIPSKFHMLMRLSAPHCIVRFIRVRAAAHGDAFQYYSHDIIIDHCSFSWSGDEILSTSGTPPSLIYHDLTVQHCLIHEGLTGHSCGGLVSYGAHNVTHWRNVWAHNRLRNPAFTTHQVPDPEAAYKFEYINNVSYNWRRAGVELGPYIDKESGIAHANVIGNYFKHGPSTPPNQYAIMTCMGGGPSKVKVYVDGNISNRRPRDDMDEWADVGQGFGGHGPSPAVCRSVTRFTMSTASASNQILSAHEAYQKLVVEGNVGVTVPTRDAIDTRVLNEIRNDVGVMGSQNDGGAYGDVTQVQLGYPDLGLAAGTPYPDADRDGMDDRWEPSYGCVVGTQDHNGDQDQDGYTNLEEYLHFLAGDEEP